MKSIREYAIVTGAYWAFTLTDGALRMMVLLHLYTLGFPPLEIAALFLFYEFFGVVTNFFGGYLGARFGLKSTLIAGLILQISALSLLINESAQLTVLVVMGAQVLSGIAKDLTKMSAKSLVKLLVPSGESGLLMRWVAVLTGSKNALKGVGFFMGTALLAALEFKGACVAMIGLLLPALVIAQFALAAAPGRTAEKPALSQLISQDSRLSWLSLARLFLFGSRDIWFALALPLFLSASLGWGHRSIGAFMALWIVAYGLVQAWAPQILNRRKAGAPDALSLAICSAALLLPLAAIIYALNRDISAQATLLVGLFVFGFVFAMNSATHSFLVVAYSERDKVALRVGFYYTANAMGRLIGTFLSGFVFEKFGQGQDGLVGCLAVSMAFVFVSTIFCIPLRRAELKG